MPRLPDKPEQELRKIIRDGRAVVVVGSGMSIAASIDPQTGKPHPQASWSGLLHSGLEWLEDHKLVSEKKAAAFRTLLAPDEEPDTYDFITTAQYITRQMGGENSVHYKDWLKDTIGQISGHQRDGLDALERIRQLGDAFAEVNLAPEARQRAHNLANPLEST